MKLLFKLNLAYFSGFVLMSHYSCMANPTDACKDIHKPLEVRIKQELEKVFHAEIEIKSSMQWFKGKAPCSLSQVYFLGDNTKGKANFRIQDQFGISVEGSVYFSAWEKVQVAKRQLHRGERLLAEAFSYEKVDLAQGQPRAFQTFLVKKPIEQEKFEFVQNIQPGQMLLSSAIRKIPDVKRGDRVQVQLISGGVILKAYGTLEEPGYIEQTVKVSLSSHQKKLTGILKSPQEVEVRI